MTRSAPPRAAVLIDRDDTLMACRSLAPRDGVKPGDVVDPDQVSLLPGVLEGCRALKAAGYKLIVFTNQGVVARGGCSVDDVARVNQRLSELLTDATLSSTLIDAMYFCPFHPDGTVEPFACEHPWRKPAPGMILAAVQDHDIDLSVSWVIGDQPRDLQAGRAAGIADERLILIGPSGIAPDFARAVSIVLGAAIDR